MASSGVTFIQSFVHISVLIQNFNVGMHRHITYCTQSPIVLRLPWLALCSRWNFVRDTGEVHRIQTIFTICLSTYLYLRCNVYSYPVKQTKIIFYQKNDNNRRYPPFPLPVSTLYTALSLDCQRQSSSLSAANRLSRSKISVSNGFPESKLTLKFKTGGPELTATDANNRSLCCTNTFLYLETSV